MTEIITGLICLIIGRWIGIGEERKRSIEERAYLFKVLKEWFNE